LLLLKLPQRVMAFFVSAAPCRHYADSIGLSAAATMRMNCVIAFAMSGPAWNDAS
jgi:hypothetical protein